MGKICLTFKNVTVIQIQAQNSLKMKFKQTSGHPVTQINLHMIIKYPFLFLELSA